MLCCHFEGTNTTLWCLPCSQVMVFTFRYKEDTLICYQSLYIWNAPNSILQLSHSFVVPTFLKGVEICRSRQEMLLLSARAPFQPWDPAPFVFAEPLAPSESPASSSLLVSLDFLGLSSGAFCYLDLEEVFNKALAFIDLLYSTNPSRGCLYTFSASEKEAMKKYIDFSLPAGIIWPSSSPAGIGSSSLEK